MFKRYTEKQRVTPSYFLILKIYNEIQRVTMIAFFKFKRYTEIQRDTKSHSKLLFRYFKGTASHSSKFFLKKLVKNYVL